MNAEQHPKWETQFNASPEELAAQLCRLPYNELAKFLTAMAEQLDQDAEADRGRERPKLADALEGGAVKLDAASNAVHHAWTICAPHMK